MLRKINEETLPPSKTNQDIRTESFKQAENQLNDEAANLESRQKKFHRRQKTQVSLDITDCNKSIEKNKKETDDDNKEGLTNSTSNSFGDGNNNGDLFKKSMLIKDKSSLHDNSYLESGDPLLSQRFVPNSDETEKTVDSQANTNSGKEIKRPEKKYLFYRTPSNKESSKKINYNNDKDSTVKNNK